MIKMRWAIVIFGAGLILAAPVFADREGERAAIAQLIHELEALEPVISKAKAQANPDARIKVRYDWLRQDLERVKAGLRAHLLAPHAQPRTFPPLRGDYRR